MTVDYPGFVYASAIAFGGVMGYYKAGSIPSLAAGLVFGSALAYGAFQVSQDPSNYLPQLAASSMLAGVMGYRFYTSGKIMPAGLICAVSGVMVCRIALKASGLIDRKLA